MKDGTLPFATINPLIRPHTTPIAQAGRMARTPMLPEVFAATSAAIATMAPTERSIEPAMTTKVMPNAATSSTTACCATIMRLLN